jgi:leukotriene-A4 hydrolase
MTTTTRAQLRDPSSLSNSDKVRVTHLDWKVTVDFEEKLLKCNAKLDFVRRDPAAQHLVLDTLALKILSIRDSVSNEPLDFNLASAGASHLGEMLSISLKDSTTSVSIGYETTMAGSAVQWLPPTQTAGRKHPYLFTQCQAIHARSLVPCQDEPGVKMTYEATVSVPHWATCVMSAVRVTDNDEKMNQETVNHVADAVDAMHSSTWKQEVPISSYLLAMAVGQLEKKDLSERCAIWSEPLLLEAVAYEFAQTEDFLKIAEDLAGIPYAWGRYDLLCLPPSFPYGGMENPVSPQLVSFSAATDCSVSRDANSLSFPIPLKVLDVRYAHAFGWGSVVGRRDCPRNRALLDWKFGHECYLEPFLVE